MSPLRVTLRLSDGSARKAAPPSPDASYAVVDGACPHCKATPFKIQGGGMRPSADDRAWEADGVAVCCSLPVGLIRAETNTIFGVREDQAVLAGRCRVY